MVCLQGVDTDVLPYGSALSPRRSAPLRFCSLVHSCRGGTVAEASAKISKISGWQHDLVDVFSPKGEHCRPQTLRNVQTDNDTGMLQDRICVAAKGKRLLRAQFCATAFHRPFSGIAHRAITPREGRRKPWSPSMGHKIPQIQVPKFRKSEHLPFQGDSPTFFRHFPSGNGETSDFFEANIRGFASKVRRFGYKKSDVFGTFPRFLPSFFHAPAGCCAAKTVQKSGGTAAPCTPNLPYSPCRTHESASFSALEGTLHIVMIFEGLHPFSAPHPCPSSQSLLPGIAKQHNTRGVPRHACREWRGRRNIPSGLFPPVHCIPSGHIMPPKMPYPLHIPPRKLQRFHTFLLILHGNAAYKTPSCTPRYVHPVPETPQKIVKREDCSEQFIARHPNRKHSLKNHDRTRMEGRH